MLVTLNLRFVWVLVSGSSFTCQRCFFALYFWGFVPQKSINKFFIWFKGFSFLRYISLKLRLSWDMFRTDLFIIVIGNLLEKINYFCIKISQYQRICNNFCKFDLSSHSFNCKSNFTHFQSKSEGISRNEQMNFEK